MNSKMKSETLDTKIVLENQWKMNSKLREDFLAFYNAHNFTHFATIARGSSDHASLFLNYLIGLKLNKLTLSFFPSLVSIHDIKIDSPNTLAISISQSGKSPDLIHALEAFEHKLALVNVEDSPMAKTADLVYPLKANAEIAVAATKSFIASLYASASIVATISKDLEFQRRVEEVPHFIPPHTETTWMNLVKTLLTHKKALISARGLCYSIAQEAALKLKETCHIQAEAFSSAEILHGPQAIIEENYPLIIFAPRGKEQTGLIELAIKMRDRGAKVHLITDQLNHPDDLPYVQSSHPDFDAINIIYDFYLMVEVLSKELGLDPDSPRFLSKVTMTR